ncbi:DUF3618 domain-containing protein [Streptomonospora nanhaiensis]|uniref:Uncharacterized protein YjbJ (UPF0337 family) n=1 Tax=Streptomonospora nanhaiensis TaxID=1323731 RepID=A0A853BI52_9ACTN|nr:DUF3618 domain-containing protein [Streptomonospora nanhaiensis]MBV2364213.1 DUF3618 domain-containing protein [Streptomonospora nanhaiensis]MBX9386667.1 DUF3618 domain-containing protein [Streptomonospora nanhaiensis]NYI95168.1 uncharacterized protein YjbJ (UPF0337 family) [Streptomonospora nanhaiensis]
MGTAPDQIRGDIEQTRAELTRDVNRLTDRTSPRAIARRRTEGMRHRARHMRERMMGSASQTSGSMKEGGGQAMEAVRSVPDRVAHQTEGNPVAAGLIAFGAGLLAASVLSESRAERQAARRLREQAGDVVTPVEQSVTESAERLKGGAKESARQAAQEVKGTAQGAAQTTGQQAQENAQHVSAAAKESGQTVASHQRDR